MTVINFVKSYQTFLLAKHVKQMLGLKNISDLMKDFRNFSKENPSYWGKTIPFIEREGATTVYNNFCVAHYYLNKHLIDAGSRSIKFDEEAVEIVKANFFKGADQIEEVI